MENLQFLWGRLRGKLCQLESYKQALKTYAAPDTPFCPALQLDGFWIARDAVLHDLALYDLIQEQTTVASVLSTGAADPERKRLEDELARFDKVNIRLHPTIISLVAAADRVFIEKHPP